LIFRGSGLFSLLAADDEFIGGLAEDPRPPAARKLGGEETAWRVRAGDYRVVYDVLDDELTITVVRVGHRREVYESR
jgi:mRNA interferase RelE/StbE